MKPNIPPNIVNVLSARQSVWTRAVVAIVAGLLPMLAQESILAQNGNAMPPPPPGTSGSFYLNGGTSFGSETDYSFPMDGSIPGSGQVLNQGTIIQNSAETGISPEMTIQGFGEQGFGGQIVDGQIFGNPGNLGLSGFGSLNSGLGPGLTFDSSMIPQQNFAPFQNYGPNNPPPVVNLTRRNPRANGVIKPESIPDTETIKNNLSKLVEIWTPNRVLLDTVDPATVMRMVVPFGIDTQFLCRTRPNAQTNNGQVQVRTEPAYAVGILCWNIPIGNRRTFNLTTNRPLPRVGFHYQKNRGELLAALAMANVASSYEIQIGERQMTINDLAESEMAEMSFFEDLSHMAVGLAFYLEDANRTWTGKFGERLSLKRIAEYELSRPVYWNRSEAVNRLVGLTYLSDRFHMEIKNGNADEETRNLVNQIDSYLKIIHRKSLSGLNPAGLRETRFLSPGKIHSAADMLLVNGHLIRWHLLASDRMPINSRSLGKSVYHLALTLAQFYNPNRERLGDYSPKEIDAISISLHALKLYIKKYSKNDPQPDQP